MTKIKLKVFTGSDCREYTTRKGNLYSFHKGYAVDIKDSEDALEFLQAGNGNVFETEGPIDVAITALKKLIEKKDVDEEKPPEETGKLEPTDEEKDKVGDMSNVEENKGPQKPDTENKETPEEKEARIKEENKASEEGKSDVSPDATKKEEPPVEPPKEEPKNVFTHDGLKALNAKQQTYLIKQVQGENARIPRYESEKIELLLKLQQDGADLLNILKGYKA